ncbi:unnamed protein product [Parajaminaea phylloscopi]
MSHDHPRAAHPLSPAAQLRCLLRRPAGIVVAPGVYDGISARIAVNAGAEALYQTGAGTSASRLAKADLGFLGQDDLVEAAGVSAAVGGAWDVNLRVHQGSADSASTGSVIPVISDADVGWGAPPQVARTVQRMHAAGVAAIHLEDQVTSKRCGHLADKELVDRTTFAARIRAACHARDHLPVRDAEDRIVIIARTDALAPHGFDEAVERLRIAREAGADVGFLEGLTSDAEAREAILQMRGWPMLANCVTGGKSPLWTAQDVRELGFKIAIFPTAGIFPAAAALKASYSRLVQPTQDQPDSGYAGIGIEAETDEALATVNLGGANSRGLPDFFNSMGLQQEVHIDAVASGAQTSRRLGGI